VSAMQDRHAQDEPSTSVMDSRQQALEAYALTPEASTPKGRRELVRLMEDVVEASSKEDFHHGLNAARLAELLGRLAGKGDDWAWSRGLEQVDRFLSLVPSTDWRYSLYILAEANLYYGRAAETGDVADIDAAIPLLERAFTSVGRNSGIRGTAAAAAADLALRRYAATGEPTDLESSRTAAFQVGNVGEALPNDMYRAATTLGWACVWRFDLLGDKDDAASAVGMADYALEIAQGDLPPLVKDTHALRGAAYRSLHSLTRDPAHLDTAIDSYRAALDALDESEAVARAQSLDNLGNGLADRYDERGNRADLLEAIECSRQALTILPQEKPRERAVATRNFTFGVLSLCEADGALHEDTQANGLLEEALDRTGDLLQEASARADSGAEAIAVAGALSETERLRLLWAQTLALLHVALRSADPLPALDGALRLFHSVRLSWEQPYVFSARYSLGGRDQRNLPEAYVGALLWRARLSDDPSPWLRCAVEVGESAKSRLLSAQVQRLALDPPGEVGQELAGREQDLLARLARLEDQELRHYDSLAPDPRRVYRMQERAELVGKLEDVWSQMRAGSPAGAEYVALRRGAESRWPLVLSDAPGVVAVSLLRAGKVEDPAPGVWGRRLVALAVMPGGGVAMRAFDEDPTQDALRRFEAEVLADKGAGHRAETWSQRSVPLLHDLAQAVGTCERIVLSPPPSGRGLPWHVALERAGWHTAEGGLAAVITLPSLALLTGPHKRTGTRWHYEVNTAEAGGRADPEGLGENISIARLVEAGPATGPPLVVGNPTGDLAAAEAEADAVARILGVRPLLGDAATCERVQRTLPEAKVVHLAAHAAVEQGDPLGSRIRLADGDLTIGQLLGAYIRTGLVVLSVCEGGRGELIAGGEALSLAQVLLRSGADAVIAGLWRVEDAATAFLMEALHEALASGAAVDAALAAATGRIRADRKWENPYYWAGFVALTGALA
jgi:CHAT domain